MKKYLLSTAFVIILALISTSQAYSQCCTLPSSQYTITSPITIGAETCDIKITFCYHMGPTGERYIKICSVEIPFGCGWTSVDFSSNSFWDLIDNEVMNFADLLNSFPPCNTINQFATSIEISKAKCLIYINDFEAQMVRIEECSGEEAICYKEYKICRESGILTKTLVDFWTSGTSDCYYEGEVPFDPYNLDPPFCFDTCY